MFVSDLLGDATYKFLATHTDLFLDSKPAQVDIQKCRWVEFSERVAAQLRVE